VELGLQLPIVLKPIGVHHEPHGFMPESDFRKSRIKKAGPSHEGTSRGDTGKRILSISYEPSLLLTREMLLSDAGFEVTSAKTLRGALECCKKSRFDLVIVGHSIPKEDKRDVVKQIRQLSLAPVLSIRRHGEEPLPEATHSIDSIAGPEALLKAVTQALRE
jgi:DNA-binding NtrC family response regulator